jgi:hypothetical protein
VVLHLTDDDDVARLQVRTSPRMFFVNTNSFGEAAPMNRAAFARAASYAAVDSSAIV